MIMAPPVLHEPTSLMRMHGTRTGRHWMAVDPDREPMSLTQALWLAVLIIGFVLFLAMVHSHS